MAKIITQKNKGITLIELLIYMSIFSIIFVMISSTVFYLQKIIQNNNQNYYIKNQIYFNLNILQQYLYKNRAQLINDELQFYDKNNNIILTQKIENNNIKNIYNNKDYIMDNYLNLSDFRVSFNEKDRLIKFDISWIDNRGKPQNIIEYLIVINQNM